MKSRGFSYHYQFYIPGTLGTLLAFIPNIMAMDQRSKAQLPRRVFKRLGIAKILFQRNKISVAIGKIRDRGSQAYQEPQQDKCFAAGPLLLDPRDHTLSFDRETFMYAWMSSVMDWSHTPPHHTILCYTS